MLPAAVSAQVLYGSLTGNVTDASDAAIPGAKVEAVNNSTGISRESQTDDRGVYVFRDLQPGPYTLHFSATSFGKVKVDGVDITPNTLRRTDVKMQLAQVTETVSISAAAATLQTDRADVNVQLGQAQISGLPIGAGRNFQQIYKTIPGFSPPAEAHSDAGNPQRALVS
ncbi:MAG: carboxypeptidase regulatory-like domain-containing protein, partial [Acidobacteria bacterium]|nr:carboxypeptidase regulatory-like domain-containing protein [Acidobacteriota bacterium]